MNTKNSRKLNLLIRKFKVLNCYYFILSVLLPKMFDFNQRFYDALVQKLDNVKERTGFLMGVCEKIKKELEDFEIIHKDKEGINVIVKFKNKSEEQKLIKYCICNGGKNRF